MQAIKGFAAALVALIACPCHLPLTITVAARIDQRHGGWRLAGGQYLVRLDRLVCALYWGGGPRLFMVWTG